MTVTEVDPADDVLDENTYLYVSKPSIDILKVTLMTFGSDLEVELVLGAANSNEALYMVSIGNDDDQVDLLYEWDVGFSAFTLIGAEVNTTGSFGSGNTRLVWTLSMDDLSLAGDPGIVDATTYLYTDSGDRFTDILGVGGGQPPVGNEGLVWLMGSNNGVELVYYFEKPKWVQKDLKVQLEGEEAKTLRSLMDADMDGLVDGSEVGLFETGIVSHIKPYLGNKMAPALFKSEEITVHFAEAEGNADSQDPLVFRFHSDLNLTEIPENMVYAFDDEFDDLEVLLFRNSTGTVHFKMTTPDEYVHSRFDIPQDLKRYLKKGDYVMEIGPSDFGEHWEEPLASLDAWENIHLVYDPQLPGPGALLATVSMICAALVMVTRRLAPRVDGDP